MSDLTDDFKLSFRSTAGINEAFGGLVARAAGDRAIRYRGKKPHRAAVLNAIVLYVDSLSREEQRAVIAKGIDLLNAHLADDDAPEVEAEPEAPPVPKRRKA